MKHKKQVNQNNRRRAGRKRTAKVTLLIIVTVPLLVSFDSMMQQSSLQRIESSSFPNAVCVLIWIKVGLHWTGLEASLSRRPTWPQRCPSFNCFKIFIESDVHPHDDDDDQPGPSVARRQTVGGSSLTKVVNSRMDNNCSEHRHHDIDFFDGQESGFWW